MVNREKRLAKGVQSLQYQIDKHQAKLKKAKESDKVELIDYYKKEINLLKETKDKKKRLLEK